MPARRGVGDAAVGRAIAPRRTRVDRTTAEFIEQLELFQQLARASTNQFLNVSRRELIWHDEREIEFCRRRRWKGLVHGAASLKVFCGRHCRIVVLAGWSDGRIRHATDRDLDAEGITRPDRLVERHSLNASDLSIDRVPIKSGLPAACSSRISATIARHLPACSAKTNDGSRFLRAGLLVGTGRTPTR